MRAQTFRNVCASQFYGFFCMGLTLGMLLVKIYSAYFLHHKILECVAWCAGAFGKGRQLKASLPFVQIHNLCQKKRRLTATSPLLLPGMWMKTSWRARQRIDIQCIDMLCFFLRLLRPSSPENQSHLQIIKLLYIYLAMSDWVRVRLACYDISLPSNIPNVCWAIVIEMASDKCV